MQHFELITESEVKDAQKDLADEITPQISELLKRAEQSLAKLERKQFALKSKVTASLSLSVAMLIVGGLTKCTFITKANAFESADKWRRR